MANSQKSEGQTPFSGIWLSMNYRTLEEFVDGMMASKPVNNAREVEEAFLVFGQQLANAKLKALNAVGSLDGGGARSGQRTTARTVGKVDPR